MSLYLFPSHVLGHASAAKRCLAICKTHVFKVTDPTPLIFRSSSNLELILDIRINFVDSTGSLFRAVSTKYKIRWLLYIYQSLEITVSLPCYQSSPLRTPSLYSPHFKDCHNHLISRYAIRYVATHLLANLLSD